MRRTTVYLPAELKRSLKRLAAQRGQKEAELIREAIAELVRRSAAPAPRLPLFRGTGPSIADDVDDELARGFGQS